LCKKKDDIRKKDLEQPSPIHEEEFPEIPLLDEPLDLDEAFDEDFVYIDVEPEEETGQNLSKRKKITGWVKKKKVNKLKIRQKKGPFSTVTDDQIPGIVLAPNNQQENFSGNPLNRWNSTETIPNQQHYQTPVRFREVNSPVFPKLGTIPQHKTHPRGMPSEIKQKATTVTTSDNTCMQQPIYEGKVKKSKSAGHSFSHLPTWKDPFEDFDLTLPDLPPVSENTTNSGSHPPIMPNPKLTPKLVSNNPFNDIAMHSSQGGVSSGEKPENDSKTGTKKEKVTFGGFYKKLV